MTFFYIDIRSLHVVKYFLFAIIGASFFNWTIELMIVVNFFTILRVFYNVQMLVRMIF